MCLALPAHVVEVDAANPHLAQVEVNGVGRTVNIGLLEDDGVRAGDWVLVHVGFAMALIDEAEATRALRDLKELGESWDGWV